MRRVVQRAAVSVAALGLLLGFGASGALASTTVPGSEYDVTFTGTGSAHLTSTSHDSGDATLIDSIDQSGTWNVVDNVPAEVWLPSASNPAEAGASSSATTLTGPPGTAEPTTVTQTGQAIDPNTSTLTNYSCTASGIYADGVATVAAGVSSGGLAVTTDYSTPGRGFNSGGTSAEPNTFSCNPAFAINYANLDYADSIAYRAAIPFSSVGNSQITASAKDRSTIPPCTPGLGPGDTCSGPGFAVSGTYKLQKKCDGTIVYSGASATGKCGSSAPPNTKISKASINPAAGTATFKFGSPAKAKATSGFQCALVKKHKKPAFKKCASPKTYKHLKKGKYTFEVRAVDSAGKDPTPAKKKFKITGS